LWAKYTPGLVLVLKNMIISFRQIQSLASIINN